jgi:hypothetical protein
MPSVPSLFLRSPSGLLRGLAVAFGTALASGLPLELAFKLATGLPLALALGLLLGDLGLALELALGTAELVLLLGLDVRVTIGSLIVAGAPAFLLALGLAL